MVVGTIIAASAVIGAASSVFQGLSGRRATKRARNRAETIRNREAALGRGALKDRRQQVAEAIALEALRLQDRLAGRGLSRSSVAQNARERFLNAQGRAGRQLDRQEQRIALGLSSADIQSQLAQELQRIRLIGAGGNTAAALVRLLGEFGDGTGNVNQVPQNASLTNINNPSTGFSTIPASEAQLRIGGSGARITR